MRIIEVELNKIEQNENSRVVYKASDLSELMHSMKKDGQLQPVGLRELPGGKYDTVFGNRRIMAAKKLGWDTISANILEGIDEDKERDILNLIENLKRQNTTVAEDGRMFCVLRDYGLTIQEIAARLDISNVRVETAIDTYTTVPKEYHAKIVNRTSGRKVTGTISASAAHTIMNIKKTHSLNRRQTRSLLEFAKTEDASLQHIQKIAPLVKKGMTVADAIEVSGRLTRVPLYVFVDARNAAKLEKKHGKSMGMIMMDYLKKNKEFNIYEEPGIAKYNTKARHYYEEAKR